MVLRLLVPLLIAVPLAAQTPDVANPSPADLEAGQTIFRTQCARCHGAGGTGGIGPSFTHPKLRRAATDEDIVNIVLNGISGTAMIGFWNLSADEARQVAGYVRSLGKLPPEVIPGDPARGRTLYQERGQCGRCHMLAGQGAGWAPDLSDVGLRLNAGPLRQSLIDPGALQPPSPLPAAHGPYPGFLVVRIVTQAGREYRGSRVNEDDFTIQIRDGTGKFLSFDKARIRTLEKFPGQSPMPSFKDVFTDSQLDDLVAYLASQKGDQ
ncbi:MAG TPA: c-type cytochrome [Gemmatimonadales bacterium]|nr:c-type cytochrome [Gemmatimonadales bacterium]